MSRPDDRRPATTLSEPMTITMAFSVTIEPGTVGEAWPRVRAVVEALNALRASSGVDAHGWISRARGRQLRLDELEEGWDPEWPRRRSDDWTPEGEDAAST